MAGRGSAWSRRLSRRAVIRAAGAGVAASALWTWSCGGKKAGETPQPGGTGTPSGKPVKLGYLTSLSGAATPYTEPERTAVLLAVEEINNKGGILGGRVELVVRDDKGVADEGQRQARDLIENQNVFLLFGVINSAVALAVSQYAREAQVPFVDTIAQSAALTEEKGHKYVFRTATTHTGIASRSVAKLAAEQKDWKRWYMIGPDYEYGHRLVEDFWSYLKKKRTDVQRIGEQWPKFGAGEFSAQINAILGAKPDAVYSSLWGGDQVAFVKQAKGFNYFQQVHHSGWAQVDLDVAAAIGADYPKGVLTGTNWAYYIVKNPQTDAFITAYRGRTNGLPTSGAGLGYTAVYLIKAALEKAGALDREKFITGMEDLKYDSIYGAINIRKCDHQAYGPVFVGFSDQVPGEQFSGIPKPTVLTPSSFPDMALPCSEIDQLRKKA